MQALKWYITCRYTSLFCPVKVNILCWFPFVFYCFVTCLTGYFSGCNLATLRSFCGSRSHMCLLFELLLQILVKWSEGFHYRRRHPTYISWMYFGQIMVKSTQFEQNWLFFFCFVLFFVCLCVFVFVLFLFFCFVLFFWYEIGILMGWGWNLNENKIGIAKSQYSKSGRHIHIPNILKTPSLSYYLVLVLFLWQ